MKKLIAIALLFSCFIRAEKKPEQWLTPERRAALNVIVTRPVIVKKENLSDGRMILTWTNGLHGCVSTQKVEKVLGKPSKDARRDNLEAIKAERDALKDENTKLKQKKGSQQ
jgi:hypothetical protein